MGGVNLLLLSPHELAPDGTAHLTGRRHQHARDVLRVQAHETLKVGVRGGSCGTATVVSEGADGLRLKVELGAPPPPRAGVDLVLAIPRPKALKRVIPAVASLGVGRVVLVNAARVEKSYFDSKVLAPQFLDELIDLGLEQARDTVPPVIEVRERFKPFVEDELEQWASGAKCFLPHPAAHTPVHAAPRDQRLVLAIGPDGGWVPFEVALLEAHGFAPISLGPRILRVEVAIPAIIAALRPLLGG